MEKQEYVKFELTLYFEPELHGSIEQLSVDVRSAIAKTIPDVADMDIQTIESGKI